VGCFIRETAQQKALSEDGNPNFASINAIMRAMGYRLSPQKLNA
jgi:DNA-binding phage protein